MSAKITGASTPPADLHGLTEPSSLPADQHGLTEPSSLPADQHGLANPSSLPADQHGLTEASSLPADQHGLTEPSSLPADLHRLTTCSLCLEHFISPRALPCQHSFCEKCLDEHIRAIPSKDTDTVTKLQCPTCRAEFTFPGNGATDFPVNDMLVSVQNAVAKKLHNPSSQLCDICSENATQKYCRECNQYLCLRCVNIHNKFSSNKTHTVYLTSELNEMTVERLCELSLEFCKIHTEEKIRFYCDTCDDVICINCQATNHNMPAHSCTDISAKNQEWKDALVKCNQELVHIEEVVSEEKARLEQLRKDETIRKDKALSKMRENRDKLITKIKEYYDQMEAMINNISNEDQENVSEAIEILQKKLDSIPPWKETTNHSLKFLINSDLLKSMRNIKNKMAENEPSTISFESIGLNEPEHVEDVMDENKIQALVGRVRCEGKYIDQPTITEYHLSIRGGPTDVVSTPSGGYVVGSQQCVNVYSAHMEHVLTLPRPLKGTKWCPQWITNSADRILVSNHVTADNGGGVIEYTQSGQYTRYIVSNRDYPRGITVSDDRLILVDGTEETGQVRVYDNTGSNPRLIKSHEDKALVQPGDVKMNDVTGDMIISHARGVTALAADFTHRWEYQYGNTDSGKAHRGVAITATGDVLVVESDSVVLLSRHGTYINDYKIPGKSQDPGGVTIDKQGRVLVTVKNYSGYAYASNLRVFQLIKLH